MHPVNGILNTNKNTCSYHLLKRSKKKILPKQMLPSERTEEQQLTVRQNERHHAYTEKF
jgi:hypothetical protein